MSNTTMFPVATVAALPEVKKIHSQFGLAPEMRMGTSLVLLIMAS